MRYKNVCFFAIQIWLGNRSYTQAGRAPTGMLSVVVRYRGCKNATTPCPCVFCACYQVAAELEGLSWGQFKPMLADALVEELRSVREEHSELQCCPQ